MKFLGVILDECINWKPHIELINRKLSKFIGILNHASKVLTTNVLTKLYYAFCYPYLLYGILVWGKAYKTNLQPLQITQKRLLRIITKSEYLANTAPLYKRLKIMKIFEIYKLRICTFVYLYTLNALPNVFQNIYVNNSRIYSHNTRQRNNYNIPTCKIDIKKNSVLYQGPLLYNVLNIEIKSSKSITIFKRKMKDFIFSTN